MQWVEEDIQAAGQARQARLVTWEEANQSLYFERLEYQYAPKPPKARPV
jgi:hypothetical protein